MLPDSLIRHFVDYLVPVRHGWLDKKRAKWQKMPMISAVESLSLPLVLFVVLVSINLAAFAAFGLDKALARAGALRISEDSLLLLALLGGSLGAYAGRAYFRHKTRKQPFGNRLFIIAVLHALAFGGFVGWLLVR